MQNNASTGLSWTKALLVMILTVGLAFGFSSLYGLTSGRGSYGEYIAKTLTANEGIQTVGDGFIAYNGSALSYIEKNGDTRWTYMVGSGVEFDASVYGVASWTGETLTVIDINEGTTSYSGAMGERIISARVGLNYTACLLAPEHDGSIVLMENGGRRVDTIVTSNQTVIDFGFFSNGTLFWSMTLNTSGTAPSCIISTYRPGKSIVGSISDVEQLMYQVMFQSSQVCCAGTTYLKTYDYTGIEDASKRKLIYGWYLASMEEDKDDPMMAYVPDAQYEGVVGMHDVRMLKAKLDQVVRMPYACTSLICKGDRVYGYSREGYVMVAQAGQQHINSYALPVAADKLYGVMNDNIAVLGLGNTVYLVKFP